MRIVLIRHGETEWSAPAGNLYTDLALTERGREAAARLRERLAGREFALVLVLAACPRAETAGSRALHTEVEPDLAEIDYGVLRGPDDPGDSLEHPGWTSGATARPAVRRSPRRVRAPTA